MMQIKNSRKEVFLSKNQYPRYVLNRCSASPQMTTWLNLAKKGNVAKV
jgi:hypothetical protein